MTANPLDALARSLGYRKCELVMNFHSPIYSIEFLDGCRYDVVHVDGDDNWQSSAVNGYSYDDAARLLYKTLLSGKRLAVGSRPFSAEDVPEFMMQCVLAGIV